MLSITMFQLPFQGQHDVTFVFSIYVLQIIHLYLIILYNSISILEYLN
jgi:hypothetical protein